MSSGRMHHRHRYRGSRFHCGHSAVEELRSKADLIIALAGNPNVGKSSLFNQITGMGVVTANYPGKTVELNLATTRLDGSQIGLMDLPGTYALGAVSEDQWVARQGILDGKPDAVIAILDSTNLERNLYLLLQLLDLEVPTVASLNLADYARRIGLHIDVSAMEELVGTPIIPAVATKGVGVDCLMQKAVEAARSKATIAPPRFDDFLENEIEHLAGVIHENMPETPHEITERALAILLLEGDLEFVDETGELPGGQAVLHAAQEADLRIHEHYREAPSVQIIRQRHRRAAEIVRRVVAQDRNKAPEQLLWKASLSPFWGSLMLLATLAAVFSFIYYAGGFLAEWLTGMWEAYPGPWLMDLINVAVGKGTLASIFKWGLVDGILAALAVGIPYVFTFYLILAVMEDSGYLNSVAFLTDSLMHRLGLHGRAMIPLIAGAGCNVPAIIGTRVLTTTRERMIASTLVTLVPCSARTAVIMAMVAAILGGWWALGFLAAITGLIFTIGAGLNRLLPGKSTGLVMELFPFRRPDPLTILKKTWYRFKDFTIVAAPIIIGGSMALGALYETGWIRYFTGPLSPVVEGWLRLPPEAGLALIIAILRKELALQLLLVLVLAKQPQLRTLQVDSDVIRHYMTGTQVLVYALVNTIYIPCIATVAVLARELGWKRAVGISAFTVGLAVLLGGIVARVLGGI